MSEEPIFTIKQQPTIKVAFKLGINQEMNNHSQLYGRFLPNQHDIGSISGLTEALAEGSSDLQTEISRAEAAEQALDNKIEAETTRAEGAESGLNTAIGNETTARIQADTTLHSNITAEENRAKGVENGLRSDLTAETTRASEAEEQLSSDIQAENARALNAEETLDDKISVETIARQNAINAEETRAKGVESGLRTDLTSEVTARQNADNNLQGQITTNANDIDSIESKIPTQASASNQLADKDFVNSSIATNTATFRGTYNSVEDLEAYSGEKDNNDYAFVTGVDSLGNSYYDNYVYNGSAWVKRYRLNNSSFTASQWAAINSNATSENIAQITTNANAINAINNTLNGYGDVVTHNVSEFATSAQGAKADTALQPSALNGYATESYVDTGLSGKQDNLTNAQLEAVNSGANSTKINQITTNANNISTLQSGKADKSTTYTKTEVNTIASDKANVGLDNLNADGQMIIDSQNGTISNCILEIPQNIKCEISNNVVTLKAGSVLTLTGSTYGTYTLTSDVSMTIPNTLSDGLYMPTYTAGGGMHSLRSLNIITSGSSLPENPSNGDVFFNTTDKKIYIYSTSWSEWNVTYPFCVIKMKSGVPSFAKDSKGRDLIFNGAGFIGHHAFVYPNVKALLPNGFNDDGTLKSGLRTNTSLAIIEMNQGQYNGYNRTISLIAGNPVSNSASYVEVDTRDDVISQFWVRQYIKNENIIVARTSTDGPIVDFIGGSYPPQTPLIEYNYDGTTITDFTIRQPYEGARNLLTDELQADVTTLTGYDSTKTQTLKNVNGTLTWVTD